MSATELIDAARQLSLDLSDYAPPADLVDACYRPLEYAWEAHRQYLERYGEGQKRLLFVGMNPGPFGMVQTGVPFGEVAAVRDWLGINSGVEQPAKPHQGRPIEGFACRRSEVSGKRLWGWLRSRFGSAERCFEHCFVVNYCPLAFFNGRRNVTPDRFRSHELIPLYRACNQHLVRVIETLAVDWAIAVGGFAEARLIDAWQQDSTHSPLASRRRVNLVRILHPSPASPAANRDWQGSVESSLAAHGLDLTRL